MGTVGAGHTILMASYSVGLGDSDGTNMKLQIGMSGILLATRLPPRPPYLIKRALGGGGNCGEVEMLSI